MFSELSRTCIRIIKNKESHEQRRVKCNLELQDPRHAMPRRACHVRVMWASKPITMDNLELLKYGETVIQ